jgi:hypothetical protein
VHAVTAHGRWIWGLSGLATAAVLAVPGARLLTHPGADGQHMTPTNTATRTISLVQPITSLDVQSQDGSVRVQAGTGHGVQIIELISYDKSVSPQPRVEDSVSGGRLTLADPVCSTSDCAVSFVVTVPATVPVTVTSNGAPVAISGVAGANVESGGAPVTLARLTGLLTVDTDGGSLDLNGLTGPLHADTGGGPMTATGINGPATISTEGGSLAVNGLTGSLQADSAGGPAALTDIRAQTATVTTGGGSGRLVFHIVPELVNLSTDGGPALLDVPGGPYALNADSDGGPELVRGVTADPSAARSITVTSGGGPLTVGPAGDGQ